MALPFFFKIYFSKGLQTIIPVDEVGDPQQ